MNQSVESQYLGETLFHFWPHEPEDRAFKVFEWIVQRGLLLTRGTGNLVDRFPYRRKDGKIDYQEVVQNARVCFTDIPEDKLSGHGAQYGKCAVGFKRETILFWGGSPVWYIANHFQDKSMQDQGSASLYGLDQAIRCLRALRQLLDSTRNTLTENKIPLSRDDSHGRIEFSIQSILRIVSFVKEMSSNKGDDHKYLYEREWRIVSGAIPDFMPNPFIKLSENERKELIDFHPAWAKPMEANDPAVTAQLSKQAIIENFYYFNGFQRHGTLSQMIEKIVVPNQQFKTRVEKFIAAFKGRFKAGGPEIIIFGT